jgi:hypothetical protein
MRIFLVQEKALRQTIINALTQVVHLQTATVYSHNFITATTLLPREFSAVQV